MRGKLIRLISILIIVGTVLLLVVIYLANFKNKPFTTLQKTYPQSIFLQRKDGELLQGDKIAGEFMAIENNLGIVSIRFQTFNKVNDGIFIFRIKEKGKNQWSYINKYEAKKFGGYPFFPFGFPIIHDSDGKYYYFELESLDGKKGNTVAISADEPAIVVTYKFTKNQLLSDKKILLSLIFQKSKNILDNMQALHMFILPYSIFASLLIFISYRKELFHLKKKFSVELKFGKKFPEKLKNRLKLKEKAQVLPKLITWVSLPIEFILRIVFFMLKFVLKILTSFYQWISKE